MTTISFGVLLLPLHQLLDAAGPIDLLNSHTQSFMKLIGATEFVAKAPIINFHYISSTLDPVTVSSGPPLTPTCTYDTCPPLDYLLIPGADPSSLPKDGCEEFLRKKFEEVKILLLVCTSSLAVSATGLLDGLNVCSNKWSMKMMAGSGHLRKEVKWVGDRRWIIDGKVWSAAGVTSGIDLAMEFARVHFDPELVELVKDISEYAPKPAQPDRFAKILDGVKLS